MPREQHAPTDNMRTQSCRKYCSFNAKSKKYHQRTGNLEYALLNPHPNCIFSRRHPPESESNDPEPCRPNEPPKRQERQGSKPEPDSHRLIEGSPLTKRKPTKVPSEPDTAGASLRDASTHFGGRIEDSPGPL